MPYTASAIIDRALRICGILPAGGTADSDQSTDATEALVSLFDEWEAEGMHIWKMSTIPLTGAVTGITCTINTSGANVTADPPLKVLNVYYRNTTSSSDTPLSIITKQEYDQLSLKTTQSTPTFVYYNPPVSVSDAGTAQPGTFYFYPALSSTFIAANTLYVTGTFPLRAISGANYPDVPNHFVNALVWNLADQLSAEYGVGLAERSAIAKKAQYHKAMAFSFDQEEGSIYFRPDTRYAPA